MGSRIRKSVSPTGKAFSVIFSCVDPPAPVDIYNTNSPINARVAFDAIKQGEINETQETGLAGGEWELVLYEHTGQSRVNVMKTEDPEYGGEYVYCVQYEGSKVVDRYSYMDALRLVEQGKKPAPLPAGG